MALGYLLKKTGYCRESDGEALTRVVYNLLLPALILGKMSEMELKTDLLMVLLYTSAYFLFITICSMLLFRRGAKEVRGILTISAVFEGPDDITANNRVLLL
jgi:predicted permease